MNKKQEVKQLYIIGFVTMIIGFATMFFIMGNAKDFSNLYGIDPFISALFFLR